MSCIAAQYKSLFDKKYLIYDFNSDFLSPIFKPSKLLIMTLHLYKCCVWDCLQPQHSYVARQSYIARQSCFQVILCCQVPSHVQDDLIFMRNVLLYSKRGGDRHLQWPTNTQWQHTVTTHVNAVSTWHRWDWITQDVIELLVISEE